MLDNYPTCYLTPIEVEFAKQIASRRAEPKEGFASTNRWQKNGNYHFHGFLGELAYALYWRKPVDDSVSIHGDAGFDLKWKNKTVDVKTVNYAGPSILKLTTLKNIGADILALAYRRKDNAIVLCGMIDFKEFRKKHYVKDFGFGKRYCLDDKNLTMKPWWNAD